MQGAVVVRAGELHRPVVVVVLRHGGCVYVRSRARGAVWVAVGVTVRCAMRRGLAVRPVGIVEGVVEGGGRGAVRPVGGVVVEARGERVRVVGAAVAVTAVVVVVVAVVHLDGRVRLLVVRRHREGRLVRVDVLARPEVLVPGQALGLPVVPQRIHADGRRRYEAETVCMHMLEREGEKNGITRRI